ALAIAPDGQTLAAATGSKTWTGGEDGWRMVYKDVEVQVWDLSGGALKPRAGLKVDPEVGVEWLTFDPVGHLLATAGSDRAVRVWDLSGPEPRPWDVLRGGQEERSDPFGRELVAFAPDGKAMATGGGGEVLLWDLSGAVPRRRAAFKVPSAWMNGLAFAPDGKALYAAGPDIVPAWDRSGPEPRERPSSLGQTSGVGAVRFTPNGSTLITLGNSGGTVRFWDLAKARPAVRDEID